MRAFEPATRDLVRRMVWASNPSSVRLADAAVRLARLLDGGDTREMLRHHLDVTLSHLRGCGPQEGDVLDELRARHCTRQVEQFEATTGSYRDA